MAVITLLTDFGTDDEYVGIMKGVILSINPRASIVDITHHVEPQNIEQACYIVESSSKYFPEGTVHVCVVDPGVGSERSILALKMNNHFFLAPDNGVLSLLVEKGRVDSIVSVTNSDYFLDSVSQTFHGRDIFAPVAAHIASGVEIKHFGEDVDKEKILKLNIKKPLISNTGRISGEIVYVDHFGNLITNIDSVLLNKIKGKRGDKTFEIQIGERKIKGLSNSYKSVEEKKPLAIIGSRDYLEISVNCGSAYEYFSAEKGAVIAVTIN